MSHIIHASGAMRRVDPDEERHRRHRAEVSDTTRRHPRSLADAFPDERAEWLDIPRPRGKVFTRSVAVCFVLLLVIAVVIATKG